MGDGREVVSAGLGGRSSKEGQAVCGTCQRMDVISLVLWDWPLSYLAYQLTDLAVLVRSVLCTEHYS